MPGRNTVKEYAPQSYYHVYTRGTHKQDVFLDDQDFSVFLGLLKRYLSEKPSTSAARVKYPWYHERLKVLCYCLMSNHVHLMLYQEDEKAIHVFMKSLLTSYGMYFNKKYDYVGPVFQSRYRAVRIDNQSYYEHISRYIHMNPKNWLEYPYSSLVHYRSSRSPEWLDTTTILNMFDNNIEQYMDFLSDYKDHKELMEDLKWQLADNPDF